LGAELSIAKTHVSPDTYEFAKRWFCKGKEITGVPMNGIVNNINNPFIVLVTLYDFFKVKNNFYSGPRDLVSVVSYLYKGLSVKLGKKFSNSKFRLKLQNFRESLNLAFGYSTYDSLRTLMCNNITNEDYMIPNSLSVIHQEIDDVIGKGVGSTVKKSLNSLTSLARKLELKSDDLGLESPNELRFLPIFKGIVNHLDRYIETIAEWEPSSKTFREKSKDLLLLDIDKVFSKERNKTLELLNTGKILSKGFREINLTNDIMYGSSLGESTYTYNNDLFNLIQGNYAVSLENIRRLNEGL